MIPIALLLLIAAQDLPAVTPVACRTAGEMLDDAATFLEERPRIEIARMPEHLREDMVRRQAGLDALAVRARALVAPLDARYRLRPQGTRGRDELDLDDAALFAFAAKCLAAPK